MLKKEAGSNFKMHRRMSCLSNVEQTGDRDPSARRASPVTYDYAMGANRMLARIEETGDRDYEAFSIRENLYSGRHYRFEGEAYVEASLLNGKALAQSEF